MKKLIAFLFALMFMFSAAYSEPIIDVKNMTDKDLIKTLNLIRNEILTRTAKIQNNTFIIDDDMIQIYCTGNGSVTYSNEFELEVVFVNNTDKNIAVSFDHVIVNGWETSGYNYFSAIKPGRKTKEKIVFAYEDADLTSFKEMEDIHLSFHLVDESNYHTVRDYDEILLNFDGQSWS